MGSLEKITLPSSTASTSHENLNDFKNLRNFLSNKFSPLSDPIMMNAFCEAMKHVNTESIIEQVGVGGQPGESRKVEEIEHNQESVENQQKSESESSEDDDMGFGLFD